MAFSQAVRDEVVSACQVLAGYQNVIGVDLCNEPLWGADRAGMVADQAAGYREVKQACPNLPVSIGLYIGGTGTLTSWLSDLAPYVDFWDFHTYYATGDPAPGDFAALRASQYYKPWLIGECGQAATAGTTAQTSRWAALATVSAEPDCLGVVGYTTQDVLSASDYALFSQGDPFLAIGTGYVERTHMTSVFKTWPGRR